MKRNRRNLEWHHSNREYANRKRREWNEKNPERRRESSRRYREENADAVRERVRKWQANNLPRRLEHNRRRRGCVKLRTPVWADIDAIRFFYECRPAGCHVDHVVPLKGETVSGLHVETNLQWMPATENMAKSNSFTSQ